MFKRAARLAAIGLTIAAVGCSGSDGAQGPQGAKGDAGDPGTPGTPGPVTTTKESCAVCHGSGREYQASNHVTYGLPYSTGASAELRSTQKSIKLAITNVDVDATSHLVVTFTAGDPASLGTLDRTDMTAYLAGYDPAAVTTNGDGFFRYYAGERNRSGSPLGTLTGSGGTFTYTTATALTAAPAGTTVQRLVLGVSRAGENTGNAFRDFDLSAATAGATNVPPAPNPRDIVPTATCNKCHVDRIGDFGHGGSRNLSEACAVCHSPLYPGTNFAGHRTDYASMVHQIHAAIDATKPAIGGRFNWSATTYPADMKDCTKCHNGAAGASYKNNPSRQACSSCHYWVNFATGANHPLDAATRTGNVQADDTGCKVCHTAAKIDSAHAVEPASTDPGYLSTFAPEYVVSLVITPPGNGSYYVAGEAPIVTVKLLKDGAEMLEPFYLQTKDTAAGLQNDRLTSAGLYVYGPRTAPKPVLTTGAAVTPVPKQSQSLLLPSTDPLVLTTAGTAAFRYQLKAIPSTMAAGTYMVRFYAQDYGYVNDHNFRVSSNAFQTIQIGTATAQQKIAGDCTRCHGNYNLPPHNARHAVRFDSDECVSCHDQSGNHADPLANRIHAAHDGSTLGDLMGADWSTTVSYELASERSAGPITYPVGARNGGIENCAVCHSSGNTQYLANPTSQACRGCHADNTGAIDHFLQNGGK